MIQLISLFLQATWKRGTYDLSKWDRPPPRDRPRRQIRALHDFCDSDEQRHTLYQILSLSATHLWQSINKISFLLLRIDSTLFYINGSYVWSYITYIYTYLRDKSPYPELNLSPPSSLIWSLQPKHLFGPKSTYNLCIVLRFMSFFFYIFRVPFWIFLMMDKILQ